MKAPEIETMSRHGVNDPTIIVPDAISASKQTGHNACFGWGSFRHLGSSGSDKSCSVVSATNLLAQIWLVSLSFPIFLFGKIDWEPETG